ncbi:uncharacterized protein LOC122263206 [Penaeus japonicus]|uniref:uncharacterized protein LOC122263206 n=1 Tax=Penaeus japonicus TaxID=27405 RepID=UPI001C70C713|nr:uncharacterized protein LOC122263206 [Penaeus japonicus]
MKVVLTAGVIALLLVATAEAHRGRPDGHHGHGRPLFCIRKLCETSADATECRNCTRQAHESGNVSKEDVKLCFDAVEGGCREISDADLETLRTCVGNASDDLKACIAV